MELILPFRVCIFLLLLKRCTRIEFPSSSEPLFGTGLGGDTTLQCDPTKHAPQDIFFHSDSCFLFDPLYMRFSLIEHSQQTDMPKICASVVDREVALDDGFKLLINNFAGLDA